MKKKFIVPEINSCELNAQDAIMASGNKIADSHGVTYSDKLSSAAGDYGMWKGLK